MSYQLFIGIDTAKAKYDFQALDSNGLVQLQGEIPNNCNQITVWLTDLLQSHSLEASEVLLCIEQSGIYCWNLACAAHDLGFHVWMEDALHLSRSFGRVRGKTDPLDAARIAKYAQRNHQDVRLFQPLSETIAQINSLVGQRRRMIKAKNILAVPVNEEIDFLVGSVDGLHQTSQQIIEQMDQAIKRLDAQINKLIEADQELKRKKKLATSVPGFGEVNFRNLVIATHGFTRLKDPRALACNVGIAPFPRQSGKCLNRKPTAGKMGNKAFKTTLTCAIMSIIKSDNRFGRYYQAKISKGKKHLVVVNALRNKILHTVLACIKNNVMYEENYSHKLV